DAHGWRVPDGFEDVFVLGHGGTFSELAAVVCSGPRLLCVRPGIGRISERSAKITARPRIVRSGGAAPDRRVTRSPAPGAWRRPLQRVGTGNGNPRTRTIFFLPATVRARSGEPRGWCRTARRQQMSRVAAVAGYRRGQSVAAI